MPDGNTIAAAWYVGGPRAGCVGATEERRVRHNGVREHLVVDVTSEGDQPGLIEDHRWIRFSPVQRQLKALGRRERIDLVTYRIAVGERHARLHGDDQQ